MNITQYKSQVASLGCMACRMLGYGETPAQLHHPRGGVGMAERGDDWNVIPLCEFHHQGKQGIHGDRSAFISLGGASDRTSLEWMLRAMVAEMVMK